MIPIHVAISENVTTALDAGLAAGADLTPAMAEIARYLASEMRYRFETETAPDGTPWKPSLRVAGWTDRNGHRHPGDGGQTLTLHGDLRNSITEDWGLDYAAAGPEASGGAAVYARIHQEGGTIRAKHSDDGSRRALRTPLGLFAAITIPARPYAGWTPQDDEETLAILTDHLSSAFGGLA